MAGMLLTFGVCVIVSSWVFILLLVSINFFSVMTRQFSIKLRSLHVQLTNSNKINNQEVCPVNIVPGNVSNTWLCSVGQFQSYKQATHNKLILIDAKRIAAQQRMYFTFGTVFCCSCWYSIINGIYTFCNMLSSRAFVCNSSFRSSNLPLYK